MLLAKEPVPVPSVVWGLEIVGFPDKFQHIPLEVTVVLPCIVTLPPDVAEVGPMLETTAVVMVGICSGADVLNVSWLPYAVRFWFVAKARKK